MLPAARDFQSGKESPESSSSASEDHKDLAAAPEGFEQSSKTENNISGVYNSLPDSAFVTTSM